MLRAILLACLLCSACAPASPSASSPRVPLDPKMYGMWALDASHSQFGGPYPAPTSGLVNWTAHGWVFAIAAGDGSLYADGVAIDRGCALIGVPSSYTCEVLIATPTHVHLTVRNVARVEREADIDLVDNNTQRAVHRVTPSDGHAYTETTMWTRMQGSE